MGGSPLELPPNSSTIARSVLVAQRDLDTARRVLRGRSRDAPEGDGRHIEADGEAVLHMVEGVEKVGPQNQLVILPGHREVLDDREVNRLYPVGVESVAPY